MQCPFVDIPNIAVDTPLQLAIFTTSSNAAEQNRWIRTGFWVRKPATTAELRVLPEEEHVVQGSWFVYHQRSLDGGHVGSRTVGGRRGCCPAGISDCPAGLCACQERSRSHAADCRARAIPDRGEFWKPAAIV